MAKNQKIRVVTLTQEAFDAVEQSIEHILDDNSGDQRVQLLRALSAMSKALVIEIKYKP